MPSILVEATVALTSITPNLLTGSSFEFARGPGIMSAGLTAAATGIVVNIQAGNEVVAEAFSCPIQTRYPILPDEMYFASNLAGGDRLVFRAQNTTGAGIVTRAVVQLSFQG